MCESILVSFQIHFNPPSPPPHTHTQLILTFACLASLIGTFGRVLSDSMITASAFLDLHIFVDFVNATFLPLLLLTIAALILVHIYHDKLV